MTFLLLSFVAGILTVLAPCILPLLPVVIGSSASGRSRYTPYIVVGSLALSIIIFTFLLKVSTAFITVPPSVWSYISGGIILGFGLILLFPGIWERLPGVQKLAVDSNQLLGSGYQKKSVWGDIVIGAALGPVFSTCSPTYFVILASVLPASFLLGSLYLLAYVVGLSITLLGIGLLGDRLTAKMSKLSDSRGYFKRGLGLLFILVGVFVLSRYDKVLQTKILSTGFLDITKVEQTLLEKYDDKEGDRIGTRFTEITDPAGFVNTEPFTLEEMVGKKVILLDFVTYSCINCQRTFPYLNAWYEKYKDQGLEIVAIHTPEFAFEKDKENVTQAMQKYGITFPVVLDNDYGTWNAYGNRYWPRKYIIDIEGNIVYDHIGEGGYEETERKIQELLMKRKARLGESGSITQDLVNLSYAIETKSSETYFGSGRNTLLGNGEVKKSGQVTLSYGSSTKPNTLYLQGSWNIELEYAEASAGAAFMYRYAAKSVYVVAESSDGAVIEVWQDGKLVTAERGKDVSENGEVTVTASTLYTILSNPTSSEHQFEIRIKKGTVRFYTITFG